MKRYSLILVTLVIASLVLYACEPEIIEREVVVTQVVVETVMEEVIVEGTPQVVEKEVTRVVEVEVEVEKVVTATPEPAEPKILTIAWTQEPDSLNRYYTSMWYAVGLMDLYWCGAWSWDNTNNAFPLLVTEIPSVENGGVSADGKTLTLNLVDYATWSDGTPITSADFLFTYDMIMDDANVVDSKYPYDYIASLTAPDDYTVVMTFDEPFAPWLPNFWEYVLPKHVLDPVYQSEGSIVDAAWNLAPTVGCGPFVFEEWESGSYISFVKNENHWRDVPKLDKLVFQFVPDDAAQTAAALAGDVDVAYWPPYEDIPAFRDAGLDVVTQGGGYNEGWYFNLREDTASPGILDFNVRKAMVMGLDRESNTEIRLKVVSPVETFWAGIPAFESPDIVPYTYDPEAAAQLLEDSGYTDSDGDGIREDLNGDPLSITQCNTTKEERVSYQAVAQQQMLAIGIDLQTRAIDADTLFASYADAGPAAIGECDIMQWSDAPYFPDPDTSYWLCSELPSDEYPWGGNYFFCDEELDALFQLQLTQTDAAERMATLHEISKYMHDNLYWIGIWEDPDVWIMNPNITGYKFSGVDVFYQIAEWDLTQ
jgi:peptide/nickel transport system substrate-binding protein